MPTDVAGQPPMKVAPGDPDRAVPLLPERAILVHIGPHKTETTTLQAAFHASRDQLAAQDVVYAGGGRRPIMAVLALRRARAKRAAVPEMRQLSGLVDEARGSAGRVVISNEAFADASPRDIARLVNDLGRDRVHVVATLRPFASILPSQWSQFVEGGLTDGFDDWLREVIDPDEQTRRNVFWRRHRHDALIGRWVEAVGADRVTVIVLDDDPARLPRLFEGLLGLRNGTLADRVGIRDRSMTWPEAEAVRAINRAFRDAEYPAALQTRLVGRGVVKRLRRRRPALDEPRIELPAWAVDRVAGVAREIAANLLERRVRILGDIDRLLALPAARPLDTTPVKVPADVAGAVAMAAVETVMSTGRRPGPIEPEELEGVPNGQLAGALGRRLVGIPGRWRSIRGRTSAS